MKTRAWVALIAVYIVWGSTYLAIRFAIETIPPFLSAGFRFLISGAILYLWRRLSGDPAPKKVEWRSASIIGLLLSIYGFITAGNQAMYQKSLHVNINLWIGLTMLCFGLIMLLFAFLSKKKGGS